MGYFDKSGFYLSDGTEETQSQTNERLRKEAEESKKIKQLKESQSMAQTKPLYNKITNTNADNADGYTSTGVYKDRDTSVEDKRLLNIYKEQYAYAKAQKNESLMKSSHEAAESIRAKYGYHGGIDGSEINPIEKIYPKNYTEKTNDAYDQYLKSNDYYLNSHGKTFDFIAKDPFSSDYAERILAQFKFQGEDKKNGTVAVGMSQNAGNLDSYALANAARQQADFASRGNEAVLNQYKAMTGNALDLFGKLDTGLTNRSDTLQNNINSDRDYLISMHNNYAKKYSDDKNLEGQKYIADKELTVSKASNEFLIELEKIRNSQGLTIIDKEAAINAKATEVANKYGINKAILENYLTLNLQKQNTVQNTGQSTVQNTGQSAHLKSGGTNTEENLNKKAKLTLVEAKKYFDLGIRSKEVLDVLIDKLGEDGVNIIAENFLNNMDDEELYEYFSNHIPALKIEKDKYDDLMKNLAIKTNSKQVQTDSANTFYPITW